MSDHLFDPGPRLPPKPDFEIEIKQELTIKVDVFRLIEANLDQYIAFDIKCNGYAEYEKPSAWLSWYVREQTNPVMHDSDCIEVQDWTEDLFIEFPTIQPEDVEALHEKLRLNKEGTKRVP